MIVDSSALLALVLNEPDCERYLDAILAADHRRMSVSNRLEASMVVDARGDATASNQFDAFVAAASIELSPVSVAQAKFARQAWREFGRGRHKAHLNYGDCFAYALSRETREPLLFKGDDFSQTDIEPALKD